MKPFILIGTAAVSLAILGSAVEGQAPTEQPAAATRSINLTVENRHVIKEIVKDLHVQSAPGDVALTVGATVPQALGHPGREEGATRGPGGGAQGVCVKDDKGGLG